MRFKRILLLCVFLTIFCPAAAFANSSWHWVTISPLKVLPVAVTLTLFIELLGVVYIGKVKDKVRAFIVVSFANIASFIAPYAYSACRLNRFYGSGLLYAWERAFNNGPHYIVQISFLVLTLCIELPLVFILLKNHTYNRKRLITAIVAANIVTTAIVAVMERLLCHGRW